MDDDDVDDHDSLLSTKPPVPGQIVFAVGDDILPRYYSQSPSPPDTDGLHVVVPYELYPAATADWAQRVRNTSGTVVVCGVPIIVVLFTVGVLLTAGALRRVQTSVLSTAFYVFLTLIVDAFVLWIQCGGEWLKAAVGVDLRDIISNSSDVLCKVDAVFLSLISIIRMSQSLRTSALYARGTGTLYPHPDPVRLSG